MPPKKTKPMLVPDDASKIMSPEEADRELEKFYKHLDEEFKDAPKELIDLGAKRVIDFLKGNISWGDMFNVSPKMIHEMVEYGYLQFQSGRYEEAERFFKMLTVLDWNNSYYHSMMGSILQRQKRYGEAIAEYSEAVKLNPHDIISMTNRGEIYMQHKLFDDAMADFGKAISLDPKKENKWANRARILVAQIEQIRGKKQDARSKEAEKKIKKGKK